jgi:ATP-dependent helicase HrpB
MAGRDRPEILDADLSDLALRLAAWGTAADRLRWSDPPPPQALDDATGLLRLLGALDADGRITSTGRTMVDLPLDPRLARLMVGGDALELGVALAALLSEGDVHVGRGPADITRHVSAVFGARRADRASSDDLDPDAVRRVERLRQQLRRAVGLNAAAPPITEVSACGELLAASFPDRIAVHRPDRPGTYELGGDLGVALPPGDGLAGEPLLVALDVDADRRTGLIRRASPVTLQQLGRAIPDLLRADHLVVVESGEVQAFDVWRVGPRVVSRRRVATSGADLAEALVQEVGTSGLAALTWDERARRDLARLRLAHAVRPDAWPAAGDSDLMLRLDDWLGAELRSSHVRRLSEVDVGRALLHLVAGDTGHGARRALDRLLPTEVTLPSGATRPVRYEPGEPPRVAAAVRDLYGSARTPTVADGAIRVVLELLSPANRPVAVTDDLDRFWSTGYPAVRPEMRGRSPRHHWPEDPRTAQARPPKPRR